MFKSISLAKITAAICLMIAATSAIASRPVANDPNWTFHSSFDNNPRKIIDTPDRVYFFVHQLPYHKTEYNKYYSIPAGAIFYLEKNNPDIGLQDLHKKTALSGSDMRLFAVEPSTGLIVIAYNDGGIDLITKDNKVTYIADIRNRQFPGACLINSISFDPISHNTWISTGSGFLCIDADTLSIIHNVEWNASVSDICPVGDRTIAIIDGALYEAPASCDLTRRDSYKSIATVTSGIAGTPLHLFPLGKKFFGYVTTTGAVIKGILLNNGLWDREAFVYDGAILKNDGISVVDRTEHTIIPTATGYYISSASKAYIIDAPVTDNDKPVLTTVALPSGSTLYSSSYDKTTFWSYRERGEFLCRTLSGTAWSDPITYKTQSPLVCKDVDFLYSPQHGFICVNREPNNKCGYIWTVMPLLTTSFKNGKWHNLSPAHNRPYYADENANFNNKWNSDRNLYPLGNPMGNVIDPVFPDYIHSGSNWCGFASTNIADPRKYPILSTVPGYAFSSYPCQTDLPKQNWGTFTGTFCAGFDVDNILWCFRSTGYDYSSDNIHKITFRYWTPDARRASLENGDPSLAGNWKEIYINDTNLLPYFWTNALALRHPKNKGKLIAAFQDGVDRGNLSGCAVVIYDHKGTLDNNTDDTLTSFFRLRIDNGSQTSIGYINDIKEDPLTGEILLMSYYDTYIIDPSSPVSDGVIPAKVLTFKSDFGTGCEFLSPFTATSACYDEYNRLWMGGQNGGVIGLNSDRSELIAHFTTRNSPLPSDGVYGLGWNPETKSLFISTDMGIAEVNVNAELDISGNNGIQDPFLTPTVVRPDYTGTVAIHNIPKGAALKVTDANGKTVANIPDPEHGVAFWNLLDKDGRRVPTGHYKVSDATATTGFPTLNVILTR